MAIIKTDYRTESVKAQMDANGTLVVLVAVVNYALEEDGKQLTRVREEVDVLARLTADEKTSANRLAQRIDAIAKGS